MKDYAKSTFNKVVDNNKVVTTITNSDSVSFDRESKITTISRKLFKQYEAIAKGDEYGVTVTINNKVVAQLPLKDSALLTFNRWVKTVNKVDLFDQTGGGLSNDSKDEFANALASAWRLFI